MNTLTMKKWNKRTGRRLMILKHIQLPVIDVYKHLSNLYLWDGKNFEVYIQLENLAA